MADADTALAIVARGEHRLAQTLSRRRLLWAMAAGSAAAVSGLLVACGGGPQPASKGAPTLGPTALPTAAPAGAARPTVQTTPTSPAKPASPAPGPPTGSTQATPTAAPAAAVTR